MILSGLGCYRRACDVWATDAAKDISGFMVLLQPGSVLMSVVQVTIKDHLDVWGLCCSLVSHDVNRPCCFWRSY